MLTPTRAAAIGRLGAHTTHGSHDSREITKAARARSAANLDARLLAQVDAEAGSTLPEVERQKRLHHKRKAYFSRLRLMRARR